MTRLAEKDVRAALAIGLDAQAAESVDELRRELLPALRRIVPCESVSYNEIDLEHGNAVAIREPDDGPFEDIERQFLAVIHQHPLVKRQRAGDLSARTLSDFLTARQFHRLELYQEFYSLIDAEDQLAFGLDGTMMVAIALGRSSRSFSERDRELLERLRPHLGLAYRNARERERVRQLIEALEEGLEERHIAVIHLDHRGRVVHRTGAVDELLDTYFGPEPSKPHELRAALRPWVTGHRNGLRSRQTIDGVRGRLTISQEASADGAWRTLILEEQLTAPISIEALRSLGLTARQGQVLRLIAAGVRTDQIAAELGIRSPTVRKHLEHIYARLGVGTRAEALALVYSRARAGGLS